MGVNKLIQDAIRTICEQAVSMAPYDKTRGGVIRGIGDVPNTYNVQVDGVVYTDVKTTGGIIPNVGDNVTVIFPTNNSSQMVINSINTQNWIKGASDLIYPVGTYYWTSDGDFNPNNSFSGEWEKIDAGVTLVSAGTGYTVHSGTAKDGGSENATLVSHTHTVDGGAHSHTPSQTGYNFVAMSSSGDGITRVTTASGSGATYILRSPSNALTRYNTNSVAHTHNVSTEGSSGTKANMPPYKCAYCWHRVS